MTIFTESAPSSIQSSSCDVRLSVCLSVPKVVIVKYHQTVRVLVFHHNKDHQRMMVDPMLMIVQSLRSFLTAVTTTAVIPIAVIFTFIYLNIPKIT